MNHLILGRTWGRVGGRISCLFLFFIIYLFLHNFETGFHFGKVKLTVAVRSSIFIPFFFFDVTTAVFILYIVMETLTYKFNQVLIFRSV